MHYSKRNTPYSSFEKVPMWASVRVFLAETHLILSNVAFSQLVIVLEKVLNSQLMLVGFSLDVFFNISLDFEIVLVLQWSHNVVHYPGLARLATEPQINFQISMGAVIRLCCFRLLSKSNTKNYKLNFVSSWCCALCRCRFGALSFLRAFWIDFKLGSYLFYRILYFEEWIKTSFG